MIISTRLRFSALSLCPSSHVNSRACPKLDDLNLQHFEAGRISSPALQLLSHAFFVLIVIITMLTRSGLRSIYLFDGSGSFDFFNELYTIIHNTPFPGVKYSFHHTVLFDFFNRLEYTLFWDESFDSGICRIHYNLLWDESLDSGICRIKSIISITNSLVLPFHRFAWLPFL